MALTYKAKAVLKALGIAHGTLSSWGYRGLLRDLDAGETTAGKPRRFTLDDVTRLALAKRLLDLDVRAEKALELSRLFVTLMNAPADARIEVFTLGIPPDGEVELLINEPVAPSMVGKIEIYPRAIIRALKAKLGEPEGVSDEADGEC